MTQSRIGLDLSALAELIRTLAVLPEGSVFTAEQPVIPQTGLYATLHLLSSKELGNAKRIFIGQQQTEQISSRCESTLRLSLYGEEAAQYLLDIRALLQSSRAIQGMRALKASLSRFLPLENLFARPSGERVKAAQLDLIISHEHSVLIDLEPIHQATIQPHYDDRLGVATTVKSLES